MDKDKILNWFNQRDNNEQLLIVVGGVLLLLYIIAFVVLKPMSDAREQQLLARNGTAETLARVQTLAAELKSRQAASSSSASGGRSIADLVDQTLRQNNLTMQGFQPSSNGEVKLRLDGVAFDNLLQWLYDLESKHSVEVRDLSITMGNAKGIVVANVRLFKEK